MSYSHLGLEERYVISHLVSYGLSYREIGRRLGRSHSTIMREIKRNGPKHGGVYWYWFTHEKALKRRAQARHNRRLSHPALTGYVQQGLYLGWSPELIAGRLAVAFPHDRRMRVSAESVYRWVYRDATYGGQLYRCLSRGHRRRRRQCRYGKGRRFALGRLRIEQRARSVALRRHFGHWEGDSVIGSHGRSALLTSVERKSRYLVAAKLKDRTAASWNDAAIHAMRSLPSSLRRTLTVDNGPEFTRFEGLHQVLGLKVYFADPCSAWQCGSNTG